MIDSLLYLVFCFLYPDRRDFIRMGLGIKARALHRRGLWRKHLELSRQFFAEQLNDASGRLLVVGIGRGFDFPIGLLKRFSSVVLVDADPLALFCLRMRCYFRGIGGIRFVCMDVTGLIDRVEEVYRCLQDGKDMRAGEGAAIRLSELDDVPFDHVVSLNLLSQIPIYFHDRLTDKYSKYVSFEETYGKLKLSLQDDHLEGLSKLATGKILVTCDREFYECRGNSSESCQWEEEASLSREVDAELQPHLRQSWLWYVDVGSLDGEEVRSIHRVGAYVLKK